MRNPSLPLERLDRWKGSARVKSFSGDPYGWLRERVGLEFRREVVGVGVQGGGGGGGWGSGERPGRVGWGKMEA